MTEDEYFRGVAREAYTRGIEAWLADMKVGKVVLSEIWSPTEYLIAAISVALTQEWDAGFVAGAEEERNRIEVEDQ